MNHLRARPLLPTLLDGTLEAERAGQLRRHAAGCRRCAARLAELEQDEQLLRMLPVSLLPLDPPEAARGRLVAMARWAPPRPRRDPVRVGLPVVCSLAAVALALLVSHAGTWNSAGKEARSGVMLSAVPAVELASAGWR